MFLSSGMMQFKSLSTSESLPVEQLRTNCQETICDPCVLECLPIIWSLCFLKHKNLVEQGHINGTGMNLKAVDQTIRISHDKKLL